MSRKQSDAASAGKSNKPWYKNPLWYFLSSLKLTLAVLLLLAVISIGGTVVEQNQPVQNYLAAYGPKWTNFIMTIGLNDMYHTWWFLSMLVLLVLNIIFCTFERFPPKWKSLLSHKSDFDDKFVGRLSNNHTVTAPGSPEEVNSALLAFFKKKRYKTMASGSGKGFSIYARKGAVGRLGSDVVHISLLLILAGAIIGSFYGYKDFRGVYVGGTFAAPNENFHIRLDNFWIDYYDTGQIRQYNSVLTVIEDDKEVLEKQIWVNEPLYYKGVRFYQSNWGVAWDRVEKAAIAVMKKGSDEPGDPVNINWEETEEIPGTPYSAKLVDFTADFAYDEQTSTVYSKSDEANNPAVMLEIYEGEKLISTPWLFLNYPGIFPSIPDSDDDLVVTGYRGVMYSGLSINKDPGTNVVWVGTAVMGLGFLLAFFIFYRRVWVTVADNDGATVVRIGGMINKNQLGFEKEINDILDSIKS
jgi:cytochrome c biogenesis protein